MARRSEEYQRLVQPQHPFRREQRHAQRGVTALIHPADDGAADPEFIQDGRSVGREIPITEGFPRR